MPENLFDDLYRAAWEREHVLILQVAKLVRTMPGENLLVLASLGRRLIHEWDQVSDDLEMLARKHHLRNPNTGLRCQHCNDPTCPGAKLIGASLEYVPGTMLVVAFYKKQ